MEQNDYEFLIASDVNKRDGIGIELWKKEELILEVFRDDTKKTKTITLHQQTIPFDLMEKSLLFFKKNIPEEFID